MEHQIIRRPEVIDELLNMCAEQEDEGGSKFPGMTYEQGVKAAIDWLTEENGVHPIED